MRRFETLILSSILFFSVTGCSDKTLTYIGNLGYDLSKVDYESVEFNVYHSNTKNHMWQHLKTLSYSPEKNRFVDVRVESLKNCIMITYEENYVEEKDSTEFYFTNDIDTYKFMVDGFDGQIGSFKTFEIKDIDEEQFYRLYPISNNDGETIFQDLKMDEPYDVDEENLDNILITIKIQ